MSDKCPRCGAMKNATKRGTKQYRSGDWMCGSKQVTPSCIDRTGECLMKSEMILEAALARKDRVIQNLLRARQDGCEYCKARELCTAGRAPSGDECRAGRLAWAEAEADKDCNGKVKA